MSMILNQITIGSLRIAVVDQDPRVFGLDLAVGSLAMVQGQSGIYQKVGSLPTDWKLSSVDAQALEQQLANLQGELNSTQSGAGLGEDGSYTPPSPSNYLSDATSLKDADSKLDTKIKYLEDNYVPSSEKGQPNGVAELGADGKVPSEQLPSLDYIPTSEKGSANGVATLDENGLIPTYNLPSLVITDTFVAASEEEMLVNLAPSVQKGDIVIRTDLSKTFILAQEPASDINNWKEILSPADAVTSVNGEVGTVVLDAADIKMVSDPSKTVEQKLLDLQSELDDTQSGSGLEASGAYVAPSASNYLSTATSLKDADSKLDSKVKEVADDLSNLEGYAQDIRDDLDNLDGYAQDIRDDLDAEVSRATDADAAHEGRLDDLEALQDDYLKVDGSRHMTGNLNMHDGVTHHKVIGLEHPSDPRDAATKQYVDAVAEGLHIHAPAKVILMQTLESLSGGSVTYSNGVDGVGAELVLSQPISQIDGYTLQAGDRVIINGQANKQHNGIYVVGSNGQLGSVFTRASDYNSPAEMAGGDFIFVQNGSQYKNTGWVQAVAVATVGTDPVDFVQFSGAGSYQAGDALMLDGVEFNVKVDDSTISINAQNELELKPEFKSSLEGNISALEGRAGQLESEVDQLQLDMSQAQTDIASKLSKSGDTMSGTLNMGQNSIVNASSVSLSTSQADSSFSLEGASVTTSDSNPTMAASFTPSMDSVELVKAFVTGVDVSTKDSVSYERTVKVKNNNGSVSLGVVQSDYTSEDESLLGADCQFQLNGSSVSLYVTGIISKTIDWACYLQRVKRLATSSGGGGGGGSITFTNVSLLGNDNGTSADYLISWSTGEVGQVDLWYDMGIGMWSIFRTNIAEASQQFALVNLNYTQNWNFRLRVNGIDSSSFSIPAGSGGGGGGGGTPSISVSSITEGGYGYQVNYNLANMPEDLLTNSNYVISLNPQSDGLGAGEQGPVESSTGGTFFPMFPFSSGQLLYLSVEKLNPENGLRDVLVAQTSLVWPSNGGGGGGGGEQTITASAEFNSGIWNISYSGMPAYQQFIVEQETGPSMWSQVGFTQFASSTSGVAQARLEPGENHRLKVVGQEIYSNEFTTDSPTTISFDPAPVGGSTSVSFKFQTDRSDTVSLFYVNIYDETDPTTINFPILNVNNYTFSPGTMQSLSGNVPAGFLLSGRKYRLEAASSDGQLAYSSKVTATASDSYPQNFEVTVQDLGGGDYKASWAGQGWDATSGLKVDVQSTLQVPNFVTSPMYYDIPAENQEFTRSVGSGSQANRLLLKDSGGSVIRISNQFSYPVYGINLVNYNGQFQNVVGSTEMYFSANSLNQPVYIKIKRLGVTYYEAQHYSLQPGVPMWLQLNQPLVSSGNDFYQVTLENFNGDILASTEFGV